MSEELYEALKLIYSLHGWTNDAGPADSGWQSPRLAKAWSTIRSEMSKAESSKRNDRRNNICRNAVDNTGLIVGSGEQQ